MRLVAGVDGLEPADGRLFFAIGVFDGLHLGHQYLLRELVRAADERAARPAVITFDHHPDEVIAGVAPPLLCDPAERLTRLEAAGVEATIVQHFDETLRRTPFDAFVRSIGERVDLAGFLMTPDSAFGFERRGTPERVAELGRDLGYDVVVVPALELDGRSVRSSDIRAAVATGDLGLAAQLLGRPYAVRGSLGSDGTLAFPMPVALPPSGRYAVSLPGRGTGSSPTTGQLEVDSAGVVHLRAPSPDPETEVRVEFVGRPAR
jgi:riboflavin kinase/FMN adenylyltransferase